jgi:signal transduction histidine kinase
MVDVSASREKRRVLIVDGDPSYSHALAQDFTSRACEVETAGTPDEAIARVAAAPPDLVVLDLYLPDNAALKLLRVWKTQLPGLVIILVSGNASLPVVVEALKEGARVVLAPAPEITVEVDADLVTRTVENIFDNALRYTPSGGSIEIELREVGPDIEIRIGNSGRAIPMGARSTIFDKYGQASSGIGRINLGLGLYFCRLAIEAQGGGIWVEQSDRMPTVFGIRLPRLAARAPRHAPAEPVGVTS